MAVVSCAWPRSAMMGEKLHPVPNKAPKLGQSSSIEALKVMRRAEMIRESDPLLLDYSPLLNFN